MKMLGLVQTAHKSELIVGFSGLTEGTVVLNV